MEVLLLKEREARKATNKLRREGYIPGVIYGGDKNFCIYTEYSEFKRVFKKSGTNNLVKLEFNGKEMLSLIKDFQIHPLDDTYVHFDLLEVVPDKMIKTRIPIDFIGVPHGVKEGGIQEEIMNHLTIETQVKHIPSSIPINIEELGIGDSIHVKSLTPPENTRFVDAPDTVIVVVAGIKHEEEEEEVEEEELEEIEGEEKAEEAKEEGKTPEKDAKKSEEERSSGK